MITPKEGTQTYKLLQALKDGKVTSMRAFLEFGITSLHRRLSDLEAMGYRISRSRVAMYDDRGKEVSHWNEYRLSA